MIGFALLAAAAALAWYSWLPPEVDFRSRLGVALLTAAAVIVFWFGQPLALFLVHQAIRRVRHRWYYRWLHRRQRLSLHRAELQAEKIMREARARYPWLEGKYAMPSQTVDFLYAQTAALTGLYASIVSNKDGVTKYSAAQASTATGQFTITPKPPAGTYTLYSGASVGATTTLVDPDFVVDPFDDTGHANFPNGVSIGGNGDPFISATMPKYGIDFTGAIDSSVGVTQHLADCAVASAIARYPPNSTIKCTNVNSPAQSAGYLVIEGAGRGSTLFQGFGNQDHTLNLRMPGEVRDCKVDGGGAMTNGAVLYMTTSTGIPISSMTCSRCDIGNSGVNGFWQIAVWDGGQVYNINRCWLNDVFLYGPNKPSLDGSTISFVNEAFIKNMVTDGVSRPNWFWCHTLHVDGYRGVNCNAASTTVIFDAGVDHLFVSRMHIDNSGATGMQLNCQDAHFSHCRIEAISTAVQGPFSNTGAPCRWSFHQCEFLGTIGLESAFDSIEIVGGSYGAADQFGTNGAPFTDFCLAGTVHGILRVTDAILAKPYMFFAFNNPITITEWVATNNTFSNQGRTLNDVVLVNGSNILTSPTGLFVSAMDVGRTVRDAANIGLGLIPGGTTITSVTDLTHIVMSANATGSTTVGNPDTVAFGPLAVAASGSAVGAGTCNGNVILGVRSRVRGNSLYNPVGVEVVAVPATGVAVAAVPWDRTYYVTAVGAVTITIQNGPAIVIPVGQVVAVRVPAGKTMTPTFAGAAPTWVVEGE